MERLASGKRINGAQDDAAGLAIAARMSAQVSAYKMAIRNSEDGISLAQTAEGAMEEITEMLQRMRELAMASANGTYSNNDRASLDLEVQQLKEEIDRITKNSVFNGRTLLDGTFSSVMQVGTQSSEAVSISVGNLTTDSLGGLSGATVSNSVTSVSFKGTEAQPTVAQLTFEANDDYTFILKVEVPYDAVPEITDALPTERIELSYNISQSVVNGGAGGIVSAINQALRGVPDHVKYTDSGSQAEGRSPDASVSGDRISKPIPLVADQIRVSYTGKSVTLENMAGMGIAVEQGQVPVISTPANTYTSAGTLSRSGGSMTYTSVAGGIGPSAESSQTRVIGGSGATVSNLQNAGVKLVESKATVELSSAVNFTATSAGASNQATLLFKIDDAAYTVTVSDYDNDGVVTPSDVANSVNKLNSISPALPSGFKIGADASRLILSKVDGTDFKFTLTSYTETDGSVNQLSGVSATISDTGTTAVALTVGTAATIDGGTSTNSPVLESVMYLDILGRDTYRFKFNDNTSPSVRVQSNFTEMYHNGSTSSLEAMAIEIETSLNTMSPATGTYDFDVAVVGDRLKIIEKNGLGFGIANFESESQGKVLASNEYGQTATGTAAKLLDDTVYQSSAKTFAKQAPVRTDISLSFTTQDTYSFTLTDGTATAVINPAKADPSDLASYASAVRVALNKAGLDGSIDVRVVNATANVITNPNSVAQSIELVHRLGKEISIRNFASLESGEMFVEATTKNKSADEISLGITRILNDDTGTSSKRVKDVVITSESLASDSLEILDRAIEDINMERAFLGAIAGRLQHTIDNLGNIATNTSAARSRIEDADYAEESAKLAKAQVLQQAGTAMLAQANASTQTVLSLLQG
jgi:flagellin